LGREERPKRRLRCICLPPCPGVVQRSRNPLFPNLFMHFGFARFAKQKCLSRFRIFGSLREGRNAGFVVFTCPPLSRRSATKTDPSFSKLLRGHNVAAKIATTLCIKRFEKRRGGLGGLLQNYFFCPGLFLSPIEAQALKGRQKGITANNFLR